MNKEGSSTRLLLTFFVVLLISLIACSTLAPLKIEPCAVLPDNSGCHAVPLNQPNREPYDRVVGAGDICMTSDDYAVLQKYMREMRVRCGDRCD